MIYLGLFLLGAVVGAIVNLAIYRFSFYPRADSPWSRPDKSLDQSESVRRSAVERVPVIGWWFARQHASVFGKGFWIRPMLIELSLAFFLPVFYWWETSGGLVGAEGVLVQQLSESTLTSWFWFHSLLICLLAIVTFIDFDDRTIPDWIVVPGAMVAILVSGWIPSVRLPDIVFGLADKEVIPLTFASPRDLSEWHTSTTGLWVAIAILTVWCLALVSPHFGYFRKGLAEGLRLFWAALIRPPRKSGGPAAPRRIRSETLLAIACAIVAIVAVIVAWRAGGAHWDALLGAVLGLGFGGGLTWAVRIIAGFTLGKEAMGFGDVTLMCMIGAFFGWQAALLVFVFAPFAALAITVIQLITTREQVIAFGPYLSLGALFLLLFWPRVWNDWAKPQVFQMGAPLLLAIIGGSLILMAVMLGGWTMIKSRYATEE